MASWITEARFLELADVVDDYALVLLDSAGSIMTWNKGATRIIGYEAGEVIGKDFSTLFNEDDVRAGHPAQFIRQASRDGKTSCEGWCRKKDGSSYWGGMSLTTIAESEGTAKGFLCVTKDLTQKKKSEDQHRQQTDELRRRNADLVRSEDRYHRMIAEVRDYAIILLDTEGRILDWNRGAQEIKQYDADEILGRGFQIFYPEEDRQNRLPERLLSEARINGRVNHEGWRVRKDGSRFWGSVTMTALHDQRHRLIGFTKVTRDLTERKATEDQLSARAEELRKLNEELRRSEEQYHRMVSEVRDYAIIMLDVHGNILNWNAGAFAIKGYQEQEVIGKNFRIFYEARDRDEGLPETLLNHARSAGRVSHEGWRIRKNGTRFWGSVVITALHDDQGTVIGYSKVLRDLTERKKADDELKESAARLMMTNQELASFTHVASHDLKEPLRKIRMFISQVEDMEMPEKVKNSFMRIVASARNMQNLIDDLLSYSVVANDKTLFGPTDLKQVVSGALTDVEALIEEKNAKVELADLPTVPGVMFQLRQVFQNLFSNALKFSRPDVQAHITVTCQRVSGSISPVLNGGQDYFRISVSDNGVGFEDKDAVIIFDPFRRLLATKSVPGTGIGLAIVKKVVENHGGMVAAHGTPGAGANIDIYLPAGAPAEARPGST